MIEITKQEAELIHTRFPDVFIARTKHKYYVPEIISVMKALTNNAAAREVVQERSKNKQRKNVRM